MNVQIIIVSALKEFGIMFSSIKLSSFMLALLATFVLFQIIVQGLGFSSMGGTRDDIARLTNLSIRQGGALNATTRDLMDARINLARAATRVAHGSAEPVEIVKHAKEQLTQADGDFASFVSEASGDGESQSRSVALQQQFRTLRQALGELVGFLDANNLQAYLDQPTQKYQDAFITEQHRYADFVAHEADASLKSLDLRYGRFRVTGFLMLAIMLLLSVLVSVVLGRAISKPLRETARLFQAISNGRLNNQVTTSGFKEISRLQVDLGVMQSSVARMVTSVREASDSIHVGTNEIATGNTELSTRTEEQAASLQQTAASMDELTSTVQQTAEHAAEVSRLAAVALQEAEAGNDVVGAVVERMNGIAGSSHRIVEIITVIDGIAFQTNILALNAAVEAARAGDQGRGFAVVASEVRGLAQRTAVAAREIKQLIEGSVEQARGGVDLVERAGVAIGAVSKSISRVTTMIGEISGATGEQSAGIAQINRAVTEMDRMTQKNAALVEQAAAAAQELHEQTRHLASAVATFELL
ncbi:methyl-accepting chemotaxis protein [Paraburkholderia caffeinilytica]|uniref:methyl-accepting chemotaxis protein n=1 Tax=Paraburkholderia caffeinilytica TaxID=1761016 RepID=UPI003DA10970